MKRLVIGLIVSLSFGNFLYADSCFNATGKAFKDAQTIRKLANNIGWKVGKFKSISAGTFIKSKKILYPDDNLEVCLKENSDSDLVFKAQSKSSDAGHAIWRPILGKKK